ncbi:stage II sporulation protein M [Desulfallas sp. Bu1-1]|uniref:stage II sporulation protein M n=1 Tax=Desulfallas sp. Bu1-1 TaxID=2787620 RepID=UPI00189D2E12|nr:stage II sporulation protein M [Desulfallas sp. Bu1-1]MBF7083975.1 stage II sporulation protein M [Desulfallas sp. Bu1-1]
MFGTVKREWLGVRCYYRETLLCLAIFVVAAYAGYLVAVLLQHRVADYYDAVRRLIVGGGLPENIFLYILARNSLVSFTALVLGIVTFNVWPVLVLLMNGAISGFTVKTQAMLFNHYSFEIWLYGLLPHGVPELGALFLACGASFYYRRLRSKGERVWDRVLGTYFLLVLPLLVLAAAVETFITPLLIYRFLL